MEQFLIGLVIGMVFMFLSYGTTVDTIFKLGVKSGIRKQKNK